MMALTPATQACFSMTVGDMSSKMRLSSTICDGMRGEGSRARIRGSGTCAGGDPWEGIRGEGIRRSGTCAGGVGIILGVGFGLGAGFGLGVGVGEGEGEGVGVGGRGGVTGVDKGAGRGVGEGYHEAARQLVTTELLNLERIRRHHRFRTL